MGRAEPGTDSAERAAGTATGSRDDSLDDTLPSGEHPVDSDVRAARDAMVAGRDTVISGESAPPPIDVAPGTQLGRYVIQERLGSGTMGLVLAAIDPSLDRKVALKVVRPDQIGGSTAGRQRLVREAQAMARLAHPNVVTVYEVGTVSDHVFVAMEHVDGSTLADWLRAENRSLREVVEAFAAAGRGLAAAHAAGIVHRDFKPANVLVSADGRVRVADFGLATTPVTPVEPSPRPIVTPLAKTLSITATGALLGTPAYMSPEQHLARPADARADQFSFCVALYEGLYRELPYAGEGYLAYANAVTEGRIRPPPRGSRVPGRLRRILLRGLATDPALRYPSMRALLADLDRAMSAGRRRLALAGAGALGAGAVVFALLGPGAGGSDPCAASAEPAAALWDTASRATVQAAFRGSGAPDADAAFSRVDAVLSQRVAAIRAMRRQACEAAEVRKQESPVLFDRRIQCLDRRGDEVKAFTAVFSGSRERTMMDRAVEAAVAMPAIDRCADKDALLAAVPPPDAPAVRARVAELDRTLDRAKALNQAGKYTEAMPLAADAMKAADELGYPPVRARARVALARVHDSLREHEKAAEHLRAAVELAAAARDDALLADIWIQLYKTVGYDQAQVDQARSLEPAVLAAVERAGRAPEQVGNLEAARGAIALGTGDYKESSTRFEAARKHYVTALGPEAPRIAEAWNNLGYALHGEARYDEARAAFEQGLALRIKLLGPGHPSVAHSLKSLGGLIDEMGKPAEALDYFQRAADIYQKTLPPDAQQLANALSSVGVVLDNLDRSTEALPIHQRAVAILEKKPRDNAIALSYALTNLGVSFMVLERYDQAFEVYQRALALKEEKLGKDNPAVAHTLCTMGTAARKSGDLVRGQRLCKRALDILEKKLGGDHPELAGPLASLAEIALARGRAAEALALIERFRAMEEKAGGTDNASYGQTLVMHGRALVGLRRAPEGIALMSRGLELMKKHGARKGDLAEAEAALARARKSGR